MKQLFPKEILDSTVEVHQFKHSAKSRLIYTTILLVVLGMFTALPFINIKVQSTAPGIIKASKERLEITVIRSGRIIRSKLINNITIAQGDTLLIMDNNGIDVQLDHSRFQLEEITTLTNDLNLLLSGTSVQHIDLNSPRYQRSFLNYLQELEGLQLRLKKLKRDLERYSVLYSKEVVSKSEWENRKFEYDLALSAVLRFKKQQQNNWQADLLQYRTQRKELQHKNEELLKNRSQFVVKAPSAGTLLNVVPMEYGSYISAGIQLAEISPDTELLAECYVDPSDIGLLTTDTKINFQIDAFNHNQWGMLTGNILEIGRDVELLQDRPVFKVRCKFHKTSLQLQNGFEGDLKKGMTLLAHFEIAERTLFQLLYDRMEDWLDPNRKNLNPNPNL